jgi:NAD(P)-dependent dehydrogenase (short-subunit alcohol dehydrogenase family)
MSNASLSKAVASTTAVSKAVILVTGASSGFGRLTAEALARAGHTVYASMRDVAGRNAKNAVEMAEISARDGVDLRALELDVQSEPSANAAVENIIAASGRIDVLVHNAGHMMFGPAESFTPDQFAQQYDVNVLGTQRVNRAALPHMRKQKQGLLVWVSSSSSAGGTPPYLSPYFAAKAAMDALAVQYGVSRPRSWCRAPSPRAPITLRIPAALPMQRASLNMKQDLTKASAKRCRRRSAPSCPTMPTSRVWPTPSSIS